MDPFEPPKNNFDLAKKLLGDPCLDEDDCGEVLSPCCNKSITIVSGSLPLLCTCNECGKTYRLREVIGVS